MWPSHLLAVAYLISVSASKSIPQRDTGNGPFDASFEELANAQLKRWNVPGVSIAVVDGDNTYAQGYGYATLPSTKAEASTLWCGGSTSKAFTTAAFTFLVDAGQLDWTTPVQQILKDDWVLEDPFSTSHVTVEDVLSHRTGMGGHEGAYGGPYSANGPNMTRQDLVRSFRYLPLVAELRTKWVYVNMMYMAAAYIVEVVSGSKFADFVTSKILAPLGMKSTFFTVEEALAAPEHFAMGYYYEDGDFHEVPYMDLHQIDGAGSMISNVLDFATWTKAMINRAAPISSDGYDAIRKPRMPESMQDPYTGPFDYTLGWDTGTYRGYQWYQHSGALEAFGANVVFFPELKYGTVAFANTAVTSSDLLEVLMWHLIDDKMAVPESERFDWNKKNQAVVDQKANFYANAKQMFYGDDPGSAPLSAPESAYLGTYYQGGYNNMTVQFAPTSLSTPNRNVTYYIDRSKQTWKLGISLEHVSGDNFVAWVESLVAHQGNFHTALPATFKVENGVVTQFGAILDADYGDFIWFDRVA